MSEEGTSASHHQQPIGERLVRVETILEQHERDLVPLRPVPAALAALQQEVHAIRDDLHDQNTRSAQEFKNLRDLIEVNTDLTAKNSATVNTIEAASKQRHENEVQARKVRDQRLGRFFQLIGGVLASILVAVGMSLYSRVASTVTTGVLWLALGLGGVCVVGILYVSFRAPGLPTGDGPTIPSP